MTIPKTLKYIYLTIAVALLIGTGYFTVFGDELLAGPMEHASNPDLELKAPKEDILGISRSYMDDKGRVINEYIFDSHIPVVAKDDENVALRTNYNRVFETGRTEEVDGVEYPVRIARGYSSPAYHKKGNNWTLVGVPATTTKTSYDQQISEQLTLGEKAKGLFGHKVMAQVSTTSTSFTYAEGETTCDYTEDGWTAAQNNSGCTNGGNTRNSSDLSGDGYYGQNSYTSASNRSYLFKQFFVGTFDSIGVDDTVSSSTYSGKFYTQKSITGVRSVIVSSSTLTNQFNVVDKTDHRSDYTSNGKGTGNVSDPYDDHFGSILLSEMSTANNSWYHITLNATSAVSYIESQIDANNAEYGVNTVRISMIMSDDYYNQAPTPGAGANFASTYHIGDGESNRPYLSIEYTASGGGGADTPGFGTGWSFTLKEKAKELINKAKASFK